MPNLKKTDVIDLIKENKFQELKEKLNSQSNVFAIHDFLLEVLKNNEVEISGESFDARKYQEEFLEGLEIYSVLEKSNINEIQLNAFSNILVKLAFKMGEFIQLMANTAMNKGAYLSDIHELYKVKPELREKLQKFIDILEKRNETKAIANIAAAKAKVSNSIGNLLEKYEIGQDMLQFAGSYENIGQVEMASKIYHGIMNDFEADSVKLSSGLFPEISQVDTRPKTEIEIFEKAKTNFERLTGKKIQEPKRVHIDDNENARKIVEATDNNFNKMEKENINTEKEAESGFIGRIKNIFKKKT